MFSPVFTEEMARALARALDDTRRVLAEVFDGFKLAFDLSAALREFERASRRAREQRAARAELVPLPLLTHAGQDARVRAAVARAPARSEPPVCMAHGRWAPRRT